MFIKDKDGLSVSVVKEIIHKVMLGLAHIHENNVIHTDIKTENILLTKPNNVIQHIMDN